ncbi:Immunoglobulin subtype,Immunoglobulin-like domain,Immunoglobulin-like [Cinara cedri]|uniref:Immunoglobulin subtype,Immunoglobulin-like domain,Immunoglobulin-like n=1 Tax=Cinara cedri TaxID=506608 RepID=A0A5E4MA54_9HEMI|nr:Immunoglobulin subtype,Immunoglobulin-like domain,Immunoglobulin-like [Cinara cedri]
MPRETTKVAWIKADTKAILAIHEHVITNNERLSVTHNDYNTWTLNVKTVRREDRGTYMCQVNTDPMKSQSAYLEVVIPPDIVYEETSGDMMIPEGGSAKLVCKARGYPEPNIIWKREDGGEIIVRTTTSPNASSKTKKTAVEGESLLLSKVTRSEMGAYLCIASNGVPPSVSKRLMLHVHFHPLVQVPNQLVGAPQKTDITLQCYVEASPKSINYWTRESGEMIITNDKYNMTELSISYYSAQMKLTIRRLRKSDLGGYKCISKNSIGEAEGNIRVYEMNLLNPRPPNDDEEEDNIINPFDPAEENDYTNEIKNPRHNSSGNTPALKDQSHRLHRSSSNMIRYNNNNNIIITIFLFIPISLLLMV